jgi:hydroxymethylglutaryl-CoA lyase
MKIIECPRDAMQGLKEFIPTQKKIRYINSLLKVGFDTIDVGSFVSPKTIPQMQDTAGVLMQLDRSNSKSKLLVIIANLRGAKDAVVFDGIHYLGFPFSISETFQRRNTNSSMEESMKRVEEIQSLCIHSNKELVVYISMAFGNPYGDNWNIEEVIHWTKKISALGIKIIALSDTIGIANPLSISTLFSAVIPELKGVEIGAHLHSRPELWQEKVKAAYENGCRRFDSAIKGFGGCPLAEDELIGNMPTEKLLTWFDDHKIDLGLNTTAFNDALIVASEIFPLDSSINEQQLRNHS